MRVLIKAAPWGIATAILIGVLSVVPRRPAASDLSALSLLDRYAAGEFDAVVRDLATVEDFRALLVELRRDGPGWIAQGGPDRRARRELAAATFALEAARVDEWNEWKWIQVQPVMGGEHPGALPTRPVLSWQPPPLLIEWGCAMFRHDVTPRPIERWWQLAALAVAQRSEDFQFLVGNPFGEELSNPQDEIEHLLHVMKRFPDERRFDLAQGIAVEWRWPDEAVKVFMPLLGDPAVRGEAGVRLGRLMLNSPRNRSNAVAAFERAERVTRDPFLVYLARFSAAAPTTSPAAAPTPSAPIAAQWRRFHTRRRRRCRSRRRVSAGAAA